MNSVNVLEDRHYKLQPPTNLIPALHLCFPHPAHPDTAHFCMVTNCQFIASYFTLDPLHLNPSPAIVLNLTVASDYFDLRIIDISIFGGIP